MTSPICIGCGKRPAQVAEYTDPRIIGLMTPDDYVRACDSTYNPETNHYACDVCYIVMGLPSSPEGWRAP